jgi:hypothetical protein
MIKTIIWLATIIGIYVGIVFLIDRFVVDPKNGGSSFIDVTDVDDEW